jgi:Tfp pilus assembly protein PilX
MNREQVMTEARSEEGNILISALIILLVMNVLGLGLINASVKDINVATFKIIDAEVFHAAESCTQDMLNYIEQQTSTPNTPYVITENDLTHMYRGAETGAVTNKLTGYSYTCTLTDITRKTVTASDSGAGKALGDGDGYSSNKDLEPKYYYQIVSQASGPRNTSKTVNTIVSVEF